MAAEERDEVGGLAARGGGSVGCDLFNGDKFGGASGGDERTRWNAGRSGTWETFRGYQHGESGSEPRFCGADPSQGQRPAGRASLRQRDYTARRQAFGNGWRAKGNL